MSKYMVFFSWQGTELNPEFFEDIAAAADKEKGAILVCNMGGRLEATETNERGMQSRCRLPRGTCCMAGLFCVLRCD